MNSSNIMPASQSHKHNCINIISNPLFSIPEKNPKITNIQAARDLNKSSATWQPKKEDTRVIISSHSDKLKKKSLEGSKVHLPVVDHRYYDNKPVDQRTTLPLATIYVKRSHLKLWHGLLFSLIIIVGSFLGAFAGYGMYRLGQ